MRWAKCKTVLSVLFLVLCPNLVIGCKPPSAPAPDYTECSPGWMLVPEGPFEMGLSWDDPTHGIDINFLGQMGPRHTVNLSSFCIQKTEVSVASYRVCVDSGLCTAPHYTNDNHPDCSYTLTADGNEQKPVNCVTWEAAREYCSNMESGDLPSEAQWEKAARGTDRRLFPWGNQAPSCSRANYDVNGEYDMETGVGQGYGCDQSYAPGTWDIGKLSSTKGDSPYGLKDMAGNLEEWVLDCYNGTFYQTCAETECTDPVFSDCTEDNDHVVRGGEATDQHITPLSVVSRHPPGIEPIPTTVGFRCTRAHSIQRAL